MPNMRQRRTSIKRMEDNMAEEASAGCTRPTGGPVEEESAVEQVKVNTAKEETAMIRVGQKAPDFSASGYHKENSSTSGFHSVFHS